MAESFWLELSDGRRHAYSVVPSTRAKYIRIKISNRGELSVTVPKRLSHNKAHQFIKSKAHWVEKQLSSLPVETLERKIPDNLKLELINESWSIQAIPSESEYVELNVDSDFKLVIDGCTSEFELVRKVINKWMQQKCRPIFIQMIEALAEEHGFHFNRLSIRSQKTRWGSCSSNKNINLNSKLILMPENIVRYVMIHELCHTIEMNHSSRFWALVEECDPDYLCHRKTLKEIGKTIVL